MGETADSGYDSCLDGSAKNAISPANLAVVLNYPPRFEIRADNRRFLCPGGSPATKGHGTGKIDSPGGVARKRMLWQKLVEKRSYGKNSFGKPAGEIV